MTMPHGASRWVLELPDDEYITPNSRPPHWAVRKRVAAAWRAAAAWMARAEEVGTHDRVHVQLQLHTGDNRRRDADNLVLVHKWCVDGLRDAGVIVDDDPEHVEALMPRIINRGDAPVSPKRWELHVACRCAP